MAAELNELFEEAVTRCQRLTKEADVTADVAETLSDRSRHLADRSVEEGREAQGRLQGLASEVAAAQANLEAAERDARARLDQVATRAAEVSAGVDELEQNIARGLAELRSGREDVESELDREASEAEGRLADLTEHVAGLEQSMRSHVIASLERVAAVSEAVVALRDALPEAFLRLHGDLEHLEDTVDEALDEVLEAFDDSMEAQVRAFGELGAALVAQHNGAVQAMTHGLLEQAADELRSSLEPLRTAVTALEQFAEAGSRSLADRSSEVVAALAVAGALLERIRPALAAVAQVV